MAKATNHIQGCHAQWQQSFLDYMYRGLHWQAVCGLEDLLPRTGIQAQDFETIFSCPVKMPCVLSPAADLWHILQNDLTGESRWIWSNQPGSRWYMDNIGQPRSIALSSGCSDWVAEVCMFKPSQTHETYARITEVHLAQLGCWQCSLSMAISRQDLDICSHDSLLAKRGECNLKSVPWSTSWWIEDLHGQGPKRNYNNVFSQSKTP